MPSTTKTSGPTSAGVTTPRRKSSRSASRPPAPARPVASGRRNKPAVVGTKGGPTVARTTNRGAPKGYLELVKRFPLRSIRTEEELDAATEVIGTLLRRDLDEAQEDYLSALTDLVEVYENKAHPVPDASEAEVLGLLMESNRLGQTQLAERS